MASNEVRAVRILVGYESVMGNTRHVAESIAEGLRDAAPAARVRCIQVGRLDAELPDVELLVLGGPTHLHGLPAERTRRMWVRGVVEASRRGDVERNRRLEPGAPGPGIREWLDDLPDVLPDADADLLRSVRDAGLPLRPMAAAFDTRLDRPFAGGAARRIAQRLRHRGYDLIVRPEGFLVDDMCGPLRAGEVERARAWGVLLGDRVRPVVPH